MIYNKDKMVSKHIKEMEIKPIMVINHNSDKIIVHTDYDEKCNIYRIDVSLRDEPIVIIKKKLRKLKVENGNNKRHN